MIFLSVSAPLWNGSLALARTRATPDLAQRVSVALPGLLSKNYRYLAGGRNLSKPVWQAVQITALFSGSSYFAALPPQWTNYPSPFYRLRWP